MRNKSMFGIRAKFFAAFFISIFLGVFVYLCINSIIRNSRTDYTKEIEEFNKSCLPVLNDILTSYSNMESLQKIIDNSFTRNNAELEIYITDTQGNVLLGSPGSSVSQLSLDSIKKAQNIYIYQGNRIKYSRIEAVPDGNSVVFSGNIIKGDENVLGIIGIVVFVLMFFLLTYGRINYIKTLAYSLVELSKGELRHKVQIRGKDELAMLAENINYMTEELNLRKIKEQENEKMKNELIVNMSHDLRTPLTSIIGYTQLLKEKYTEEDNIKSYIRIIDDKSHRLQTMIEDLFEYTALSNSEVSLNKSRVSLNELVRQVVEGMLPLGNQNDITIVYSAPENELIANIDTFKIVRVFENIITNAVKYSEQPGTVEVSLFKRDDKAVVSIYNKGRTLNEDELKMIFERFYRTDEARSSETGGTGIGLSIAKSIVELHKGEIWSECDNEGVNFIIALKIE